MEANCDELNLCRALHWLRDTNNLFRVFAEKACRQDSRGRSRRLWRTSDGMVQVVRTPEDKTNLVSNSASFGQS